MGIEIHTRPPPHRQSSNPPTQLQFLAVHQSRTVILVYNQRATKVLGTNKVIQIRHMRHFSPRNRYQKKSGFNAQMPRGLQVVIFLHFGLLSVLRLTLWTSRSQQARGLVSTIKAIYSWNWILHNVKSTNNDKSVKSFSSSLFDKFRKLVINKNGGCSLFSQQRHCVPIWRWLLMVPRRKVGSCKNNPILNHLTI